MMVQYESEMMNYLVKGHSKKLHAGDKGTAVEVCM